MKTKVFFIFLIVIFWGTYAQGEIRCLYFRSVTSSLSSSYSGNSKSDINALSACSRWNIPRDGVHQEEATDNIKIENIKKNIQRLRGKSLAYILGGLAGTPLGILLYVQGTKQPHTYDEYGHEEINFLEGMGIITSLVGVTCIVIGFNLNGKANALEKELAFLEKENRTISLNLGIYKNSLALTVNYKY